MKNIIVIAFAVLFLNPLMVYAEGQTPPIIEPPPATSTSTGSSLPVYQGVDGSLRDYLCTPSDVPDGKDLERCINRLYRFGISAGALLCVFFVVVAGYFYITGGETGKGKGKAMLLNSVVGMAILLGSYLLLYFINPSLVNFRAIQPPIFTAADIPDCSAVGLGEACMTSTGIGVAGGSCAMPLDPTKVIGFNSSEHNPWDNDPETPARHRTVRQEPNSPPPKGAVDIRVGPKQLEPVYAPISGRVVLRRDPDNFPGEYISITSDVRPGSTGCENASDCANMAHIDPTVNVGDMVSAGQQVGKTFNNTGSLGPVLHLELKIGGKWILGDGKQGTWDNMKSTISSCSKNASSSGGTAPAGMVDAKTIATDIVVDMRYATTNNFMKKKLYTDSKCYLTKATAEKLKAAQAALKKENASYSLKVYDCYRPVEVQKQMRDWGDAQTPKVSTKYIATPGSGKHPKGLAVDVTIVNNGTELSMPSEFDKFDSTAGGSNSNSLLLKKIMTDKNVGFTALGSEWWHFSN